MGCPGQDPDRVLGLVARGLLPSHMPRAFLQCQRAGVKPAAPAPVPPQPWEWRSNIICKEKLLVPRVQGLELMLECREKSV